MYCSRCGRIIKEGNQFCTHCGLRIGVTKPTQASPILHKKAGISKALLSVIIAAAIVFSIIVCAFLVNYFKTERIKSCKNTLTSNTWYEESTGKTMTFSDNGTYEIQKKTGDKKGQWDINDKKLIMWGAINRTYNWNQSLNVRSNTALTDNSWYLTDDTLVLYDDSDGLSIYEVKYQPIEWVG